MILGTDISHWQDDDTTVREMSVPNIMFIS